LPILSNVMAISAATCLYTGSSILSLSKHGDIMQKTLIPGADGWLDGKGLVISANTTDRATAVLDLRSGWR